MRKAITRITAATAMTAVLLLAVPGFAQAHTGGRKVAAMAWRESGSTQGFDSNLKVWNYTNQRRRVRVTVEFEGEYTIESQECDSFGCFTEYDFGTVVQRVSTTVRVPAFGTNRKHISGSWSVPAGATMDFVFADIVHVHI
jgi:hypothetical protein